MLRAPKPLQNDLAVFYDSNRHAGAPVVVNVRVASAVIV